MNNMKIYRLPRLKRLSQNVFQMVMCTVCLLSATLNAQIDNEFEVKPETFYENELLCKGGWKYPLNCSNFDCDYKASWEYQDENDEIIFTISTKNRNKWTGIGFSDNQAMPETDAILGLVEESGRFFLMDSYLQAYEAPPLDQQQNLYNMSAWRENGITTLRFSRPRQTGDSRDYQFTDTDCPYFIFPVMGGVFNAVNKRIRKHESTPVISDQRICIRSCRAPTTTTSTSTTTSTIPPTTVSLETINQDISSSSDSNRIDEGTKVYRAEVKFLNLPDAQTMPIKSNARQELVEQLEENLYRVIKSQFDRIRRVEINELMSEKKNADGLGSSLVIVDLTIKQQNKEDSDETQTLVYVLNSAIQNGKVGDFNIDPKYLVLNKKDAKSTRWLNITFGGFDKFSDEEQKWIIIGIGISSLVLLALIQLMCMFCRCKKSSSESQNKDYIDEKDNGEKHWKEYTGEYPNMYQGYAAEDYGYGGSKVNSLHKSYRDHSGHYHSGEYHSHPQYHSQSLEHQAGRHHYEHGSGRRSHNANYELDERHHGKHVAQAYMHQLQPDFYFMPHQRKYSSDVMRVFVDYGRN